MTLTETVVRDIVKCLREKLDPYLIIVFGSLIKGTAHAESDLDIAFMSERQHSAYEVFLVAQHLVLQLGCEVDLVDLKSASTVMRAQVVSSGQVIYCMDETRRQLVFMRWLKEYALLNEERKCILERVKRQGNDLWEMTLCSIKSKSLSVVYNELGKNMPTIRKTC